MTILSDESIHNMFYSCTQINHMLPELLPKRYPQGDALSTVHKVAVSTFNADRKVQAYMHACIYTNLRPSSKRQALP